MRTIYLSCPAFAELRPVSDLDNVVHQRAAFFMP
jgi:hypothetical protein